MAHHYAQPGRPQATCQHCPAQIVQLPSGAWVDDGGYVQCAKATGPLPAVGVKHEPMPMVALDGAVTLTEPLDMAILRLAVGAAGSTPPQGACLTADECQHLFAELDRLRALASRPAEEQYRVDTGQGIVTYGPASDRHVVDEHIAHFGGTIQVRTVRALTDWRELEPSPETSEPAHRPDAHRPALVAPAAALAAAVKDWDDAVEGTGAGGQALADAARTLLALLGRPGEARPA